MIPNSGRILDFFNNTLEIVYPKWTRPSYPRQFLQNFMTMTSHLQFLFHCLFQRHEVALKQTVVQTSQDFSSVTSSPTKVTSWLAPPPPDSARGSEVAGLCGQISSGKVSIQKAWVTFLGGTQLDDLSGQTIHVLETLLRCSRQKLWRARGGGGPFKKPCAVRKAGYLVLYTEKAVAQMV